MNIGGIGTNFGYQFMQPSMIRQYVEQFGSPKLKQMVQQNNMTDDQIMQYIIQHPEELQGSQAPGQYGQSAAAASSATQAGAAASAAASSGAAAAAAASSDQVNMSEDSSDCYDEDDEIPSDEAMATSQMCGMDDVSGADRCKPYTQQCLGEAKAIKKVLENIQRADQDNTQIGSDISQVDQIIQNLSQKLRKGKKAADSAFSNPQDAAACQREVDELVRKAVEIAANNGVEFEVSEKRAQSLQGGGPGPAGAIGATGNAQGADKAKQANLKAQQDKETKQATQANKEANKANEAGDAGGGQEDQKPFRIMTEPQEVNKEIGLDEVQNNPQLAQALEASLDETIAQLNAKGLTGQGTAAPQTIDLGETRQGSPLDLALGGVGKAGQPAGSGSVFGAPQATPHAIASRPQAAGSAPSLVNAGSLAEKMRLAGIDPNKKFNVKMRVFEPGMAVQVQRDGDSGGPIKVGKNLGGATMKVKPPPLAAIDPATGQIHRLGDIHATDGGRSGIFSAKIKEGQPIMNLQAAVNTIQGDVALPGTKTEAKEAKAA